MKLILCIFILSIGLPAIIQGGSSCSTPGFFVNEHDCSKFYRCADHSTEEGHHFVRYDFDCPKHLVFDSSLDVCVHAGDGGCGGGGWGPPPPTKGWAPPPKTKGWAPPPTKGWAPPPTKGWAPPPKTKGWAPPSKGKGWAPPTTKGWAPPPPTKGWAPPPKTKGWSAPAPTKGWTPPKSGWGGSDELSPEGSNQLIYRPRSNSYIVLYSEEDEGRRSAEEDRK